MRIHTLIHAPFEKAGAIEYWADKHGHRLSATHTYQGETLPPLTDIDLLIIMGGPQGTNELDLYPYLQDEITYTRRAIDSNLPVLGICLGAQIIAASLGAKTVLSPHKEVGVFPIELTDDSKDDPVFKMFPHSFSVMHWHNEMPGFPDNTVLLASSSGCPRQALRYSDRVYALQFHIEMTPTLVQGMIEHCAPDLKPGMYIQDAESLRGADFTAMNEKLYDILDYLAALVR